MPKHFYPSMIIFLLGSFILFSIWSAFQASTQGTEVTDRDYYSKGLKYNATQVEKKAAISLGWKISSTLAGHQLEIKLEDGDDHSVTGATGLLHLYSRPDLNLQTLPLTEITSGKYQALLPDNLKGGISIRVEFERDGAKLNRQLLINI